MGNHKLRHKSSTKMIEGGEDALSARSISGTQQSFDGDSHIHYEPVLDTHAMTKKTSTGSSRPPVQS